MSKTWFIIGSNSFSGASFIRHLLEKRETVAGCSRSKEAHAIFLPYKWIAGSDKFVFHQLDLNRDTKQIINAIRKYKAEYVVNFAAQGMVAQSWDNPEHWYQTNVVAQVKLHEQLRKLDFLKKYVHVSTPEIYGSTEGNIRENFNFAPSTPYAVSKAACDLHLMSFFKAYGFPVVFTRAANVYGSGQQLYRIIPRTMFFGRSGLKLQLHGGGCSIRSFIHINDVASATYCISLNGKPGEAYHISTPDVITIRELVVKICSLINVPFDNLVEMTKDGLGKDHAYILDSGKINKELGWNPQVKLEDGLKETLAWIDGNMNTLRTQELNYIHKS